MFASATWPESVGLHIEDVAATSDTSTPDDDDDSIIVAAVAGSAAAAAAVLARPLPGRARACIVGPVTMTAETITGWAQRALLGTANPLIGAAVRWVVPDRVSEFDMPQDARASHHARNAVRAVVEPADPVDDVLLAASELTANAVQHAGGAVRLTAVRCGPALTISMTDRRADAFPAVQRLRGVSSTGRGLAIVDTISDHWGVTVYYDRKVVWCSFGTAPSRRTE